MTDPQAPDPSDAQLLEDVYRRFVHLVLYARKGEGTWSDEDELTAFAVYLGDPVVVSINDEPHGYRPAQTVRALAEGEEIGFDDLKTERVPRPKSFDPPYLAAERSEGSWRVRFDFSRQHPRAVELLATGDEFFAVAERAFEAGQLRAFAENAFHACESYAKAELFSYPIATEEIEGSKKHSHIQSAYDLWARLDNTDKRFPGLLRALHEARENATYGDGNFEPDPTLEADRRAILREQRAVAHAATAGTTRQIKVIATREIQAGTLVTNADATLRPRKAELPSS